MRNLLQISYSILEDIYKLKAAEDLPDLKVIMIDNYVGKEKINRFLKGLSKDDKWIK